MTQKSHALPVGVQKVRFSFRNHLLPPIIGLAVSLAMYGVLNFPSLHAQTQYYLTQFNTRGTAATAAPAADIDKQLSEVVIPDIKVKAPVIYEPNIDNSAVAYALRNGVVHYGNTALPGERGNVALFGHSSGVAWAPGEYKFVFTLLDKLQNGSQVTLYYKGIRYTYVVTDRRVISPTDIKALDSDGKQSQLLLITCTPVGSSEKRLVLYAKQVSPDPANNKPYQPRGNTPANLPGN